MKRPMFIGEVVMAVRPREYCGHWFEHGAVVELISSGPLGLCARGKNELIQILEPDEFRPFYDEE